ncbi:amidohydrolase [Aspergillus avenaceus]|uniref:Amidohydrolase n=1 Tax=Aspergillus avenaceus TaxID=36643 RepID=A0A5N6TK02_ASPAV|nr:amidohydrolase [Aspergillus avenaceus]
MKLQCRGEMSGDSNPPSRNPWFSNTLILAILIAIGLGLHLPEPVSDDYPRQFEVGLQQCRQRRATPTQVTKGRNNPRWNRGTGQQHPTVLRNVTLFDGQGFINEPVDITFLEGIITSIDRTTENTSSWSRETVVYQLEGRFVTPGLVDMHSHHLLMPFPKLPSTNDVNEKPLLGPLTPFIRAIDGFKAYDPTLELIASGGVTASLLLPGSGNIIGGQGYVVKNSRPTSEPLVERLLLEDGLPPNQKQRYLKMACGENPKSYGHTRMGLIWLLRQHLTRAQELRQRQDQWCRNAERVENSVFKGFWLGRFQGQNGQFPDSWELEATVALLRGQINLNVHCYEPQDIERLLAVCKEFNIVPRALHHALEAWRIPEAIKDFDPNITIALFAENAFYKHEAFDANLRAGKILSEHALAVAFKSDHTGEKLHSKYLLSQASLAYSFGMSADKALQAVTSVPARSIRQDHRIGYARVGYDADLAVWDAHPLAVGATPAQVFIDGVPQIGKPTGAATPDDSRLALTDFESRTPNMRPALLNTTDALCKSLRSTTRPILFTGIKRNLLSVSSSQRGLPTVLAMFVHHGKIVCLDTTEKCQMIANSQYNDVLTLHLENGHVTPGLIAVSESLGLIDIAAEDRTGDGKGEPSLHEEDLVFAQYGVHFDGPTYQRARIGGVTKAVTIPLSHAGLIKGVSAGIRTSGNISLPDAGIFQGNIALHVNLGQGSKGKVTPTISVAVKELRAILAATHSKGTIFAKAASGEIPTVVHAYNKYDILRACKVKLDFPATNIIIHGGHEAPLVAKELRKAGVPVILTGNRGAPEYWDKRDTLPGPPLSKSAARVLTEAGVQFGIAIREDWHLQSLASEAGWAAKYAKLNDQEAIALVSTNIEAILNLKPTNGGEQSGDFVVWEGNPLTGEGSVVMSFDDTSTISACWPDSPMAVV